MCSLIFNKFWNYSSRFKKIFNKILNDFSYNLINEFFELIIESNEVS